MIKNNINIKGKTVDVLAETKDGILNIELNNGYYPSLHKRNAGYIFSKYSEEIKVSETYDKMRSLIKGISTKVYILPEEKGNSLQLEKQADGTYKFFQSKYRYESMEK